MLQCHVSGGPLVFFAFFATRLKLKTLLQWGLFCPKWSHFSLPEHTPKLTKLGIYVIPAKKCHNRLSSSISTSRWCYNQGKCILVYNSHILCRTFKNLICTRSLNCAESCDIGPFHKFAKCRKPTFSNSSQLFSQISTKLCTQHLHYLDSPDKNLLKNVDIPNNTQVVKLNFLYILLKTHSVGYLHIGLSEWHETQVTTSPWATKALWKNYLTDLHKVCK